MKGRTLGFGAIVFLVLSYKSVFAITCTTTVQSSQNISDLFPAGARLVAAVNSASAGATICLSDGAYWLAAGTNVTLKANQHLVSASQNAAAVVVNIPSGMQAGVNLANGSSVENFSLREQSYMCPMGSSPPHADCSAANATTFAVLAYGLTSGAVRGMKTYGFILPIGVNQSSNISIVGNYLVNNGTRNDSGAAASIWTSDSSDILINSNTSEHGSDRQAPRGDGEMGCYNSLRVKYISNNVLWSGASGMYLVNCDNAVLDGNKISRSGEWGLDIVSGTNTSTVKNNRVEYSQLGGVVYEETTNGHGDFQYNIFSNNDQVGGSYCNGINVIGNTANVSLVGNTTPSGGQVICTH